MGNQAQCRIREGQLYDHEAVVQSRLARSPGPARRFRARRIRCSPGRIGSRPAPRGAASVSQPGLPWRRRETSSRPRARSGRLQEAAATAARVAVSQTWRIRSGSHDGRNSVARGTTGPASLDIGFIAVPLAAELACGDSGCVGQGPIEPMLAPRQQSRRCRRRRSKLDCCWTSRDAWPSTAQSSFAVSNSRSTVSTRQVAAGAYRSGRRWAAPCTSRSLP